MTNGKETKIIDYDYSQLDYRGADVAAYINEASLNYDPTLPNFHAYEHERLGKFNGVPPSEESGYINVDYVLKTYLERFYEKHADRVLGK